MVGYSLLKIFFQFVVSLLMSENIQLCLMKVQMVPEGYCCPKAINCILSRLIPDTNIVSKLAAVFHWNPLKLYRLEKHMSQENI